MPDILNRIRTLLQTNNIEYREAQHEPTFTSEESAMARGEDVKIGGKAILLKLDAEYKLFVLSAAKKLDSKALKRHFGVKSIRFATSEELKELTGLVPGCVPPFGRPILDFDLYVDNSILENDKIAFNAGSLTNSIVMRVADYRTISRPQILSFSSD